MRNDAGDEFVAYFRTGDRHDLDEQIRCVMDHAESVGGEVVAQFRDDEKTRRSDRPGLKEALDFAKRHVATLIIATLKGLSRDVRFLRLLMDSGVEFVACDIPDANTSTIRLLTALADYDARLASSQSRRALAAFRAKGGKLGAARPECRNLDAKARAKGARAAGIVVRAKADEAYRPLAPVIRKLRGDGLTLKEIADRLNADGHQTRRGRPWNPTQVARVLKRAIAR